MPDIVLTTINARYTHTSLGLRYLQANLGDLHERSMILEFVLGARTEDMLERILAARPRIVGIGVYIWNVDEATRLAQQLRELAPQVKIVVGGPEVSYEHQGQTIVAIADHLISGPADLSFAKLCRQLLDGPRPLQKTLAGEQPELAELRLPYTLYSDEDIAHRHLYIEASRGCPFRCEFCLSSLDKTAWPFDTDTLLVELATLYARGARQFRFVDRTFNLKVAT
ncbi:MAG: B12-binding domain-containing radical SAM protein, partial [Quisquiliibacterium sp.]